MVGQLFGEAASSDFVLRQFRFRDDPKTVATGSADYSDLFRVDRAAGTIHHTSDFARQFARLTGAHSECVARRIARHLWELRESGKTRPFERHQELSEQVNAWAYYRFPCSETLERELLGRLGQQASFDIAYRRACSAAEAKEPAPEERLRERDVAREFSSVGGDTYQPNPTQHPLVLAYVRNATQSVPTPVDVLRWAHR